MFQPPNKDSKPEFDHCVLCGVRTKYTPDTPISRRVGYVCGSGQLCPGCWRDVYIKQQLFSELDVD